MTTNEIYKLHLEPKTGITVMGQNIGLLLQNVYNVTFNCYYGSVNDLPNKSFYYNIIQDPINFIQQLFMQDSRMFDDGIIMYY